MPKGRATVALRKGQDPHSTMACGWRGEAQCPCVITGGSKAQKDLPNYAGQQVAGPICGDWETPNRTSQQGPSLGVLHYS